MVDRRSNRPTGSSAQTPWIFNTDLRIDKKITFKFGSTTFFLRITNLFDKHNVLNVYEATDSAHNDGFLGDKWWAPNPDSGPDIDKNGINDLIELYTAINIDNHEAYRTEVGKRLYSPPRQIFVGLSLEF